MAVGLGLGSALAALAARGVAYGTSDHSLLVPIIRRLADPKAYPGDYLFASLEGYSTYFYHLVAALRLSDGGLEAFFLTGAVLFAAAGLALLSRYCLVRGLTKTEVWLAASAFALGYNPSLGRSFFDLHLSHALPGIVLGLLAVLLFARERHLWAFAVVGLMLNLHGMYAAFLFGVLAVSSLLEPRRDWRRLILGTGLTLLIGLPILWAQLGIAGSDVPLESWLQILRIRSPHHIFLSGVKARYWLQLLTFLVLLARPWSPAADWSGMGRLTRSALLIAGLGILASGVLVEWHPVMSAVRAQTLRATFWLFVIGLPWWARSLSAGLTRPGILIPASTSVVLASLLLPPLHLKVLALGYLASLVAARRLRLAHAADALSGAYLAGVAAASLGRPLCAAVGLSPPPIWPLTGVHTWILVATAIAGVLACAARKLRRTGSGAPALASAAVLVLGLVIAGLRGRGGSLLRTQEPAWRDVQLWASTQTPVGSTFVVPPYLEGFRVFSRRNQFVDWKDGTLGNFNPDFAVAWWRRMTVLGLDFDLWAEPGRGRAAYRAVGRRRVCGARTLGEIDFLITEEPGQAEDLALAYSNSRFYVRRVECGAAAGAEGPVRRTPSGR